MFKNRFSWFRRGRRSAALLRRYQLVAEALEPRQLLATVNWISATSGSWDAAANWSTNAVPGTNDDVVINVSGATPTVTISSNVESIHSITADDPLAISGGSLSVAANSSISGGLSMTGGSLTASGSGVSFTVTGTTTVPGASLYAQGGSVLALPGLTSYSGGGLLVHSTLSASGANSLLSLPNLQTITVAAEYGSYVQVGPTQGGDVELPALTQITGPAYLSSSNGSGTLNVPDLSSFTGGGTISDSGGTLSLPALTNASGSTLQIGGGTTMTLPTLTQGDGANLEVSEGASLALPGLTSYSEAGCSSTPLSPHRAPNSLLSLPNLQTITAATDYGSYIQVGPSSGGDVELPAVIQMTGPAYLSSSDGSGTLNVPGLSSFTGGGTISDSGGTLSLPALTNASGSTLQIGGGTTMTLPTLTQGDGANFEVSDGSTLAAGLDLVLGRRATRALDSLGIGSQQPALAPQPPNHHRSRGVRLLRPGGADTGG